MWLEQERQQRGSDEMKGGLRLLDRSEIRSLEAGHLARCEWGLIHAE